MIAADPAARPSLGSLRTRLVRLAGGPEALGDLARELVEQAYAAPDVLGSEVHKADVLESDVAGPGPDLFGPGGDSAGDDEPAPFDPEVTKPIGPPLDPPA
jgi:hypothetical protein